MQSPLEQYVAEDTGCTSREELDRWQFVRLREALAYAKQYSRFYRALLADVDPAGIQTRADLCRLPFTTPEQLRTAPSHWLCCSAARVERAVTLKTSGTTAAPKRVFFTVGDLARTVDFFSHGMRELAAPGDRVAILLPTAQQDSVGDLLRRGLLLSGMTPVPIGPVADVCACYEKIRETACTCAVGIPVQVLALAQYGAELPASGRAGLKTVLLSADTTPPALIQKMEALSGWEVFTHFGMTEMGYGIAVECAAHTGCHIRENDILVEVADPVSGAPLPSGQTGEFIFTTLRREAVPFFRYRSGDRGMVIEEPCPCGSFLRRMIPQGGRLRDRIGDLSLWALDERIFPCPGVVDFSARLNGDALELTIYGLVPPDPAPVRRALGDRTAIITSRACTGFSGTGMRKRSFL